MRNEAYYRNLLLECVDNLGPLKHKAFLQDDGGVLTEPLCLRVPELVAELEGMASYPLTHGTGETREATITSKFTCPKCGQIHPACPPSCDFRMKLEQVIDECGAASVSNTPSGILATYLIASLKAFDTATQCRDQWLSIEGDIHGTRPGQAISN